VFIGVALQLTLFVSVIERCEHVSEISHSFVKVNIILAAVTLSTVSHLTATTRCSRSSLQLGTLCGLRMLLLQLEKPVLMLKAIALLLIQVVARATAVALSSSVTSSGL
jgi:hypothetical protein